MIPLGKPKIDSLRIVIPLDKVKVLEHPEFLRILTTINPDGEILNEKQALSFRNHSDSKSIKYILSKYDIAAKGPVLKLGISSKTLGTPYFDGINSRNLSLILKKLKEEKVIEITPQELLKAKIVDVDFCIDNYLEHQTITELFSTIKKLTRPTKKASLGSNVFNLPTNKGIEFGTRNGVGRAYRTKQYLKFYAKALEMIHNSNDFYMEHIEPNLNQTLLLLDGSTYKRNWIFNPERLLRIETTIKNSAHFKIYGLEVETLEELLSIEQKDMFQFFNRAVYMHMISRRYISPDKNKKMKPNQMALMIALESRAKELHMNPIDAIEYLADDLYYSEGTPQELSRKKKELLELYTEYRATDLSQNDTKQTTLFEAIKEAEILGLIPKS